jgi:myo-inositol-1-phosphate synthase
MGSPCSDPSGTPLLLVAGAKGAVASTLALAVAALGKNPESVLSSLTTQDKFPFLAPWENIRMAGWDNDPQNLTSAALCQGIVPDPLCRRYAADLEHIDIRPAPSDTQSLPDRVARLIADIRSFKAAHSGAQAVFVNLLPAASNIDLEACADIDELYRKARDLPLIPDLAYALAAVLSDTPVVNFSPNPIEIPALLKEAAERGVPIAGRDGKTGQTYLKVVLASALKSRKMIVDGWYSLNILGNADGRNLMDPERAAGKVSNKTELLDEILGYPVGHRYGVSAHKVHIDYYPPRGDAKEAWDVIDFRGLFDLPMSIRLNLQGRDSILAAPLVLDLARWMAALQMAGRGGPVPELGFFFKKPVGQNPPFTFQDQLNNLEMLERFCRQAVLAGHEKAESIDP